MKNQKDHVFMCVKAMYLCVGEKYARNFNLDWRYPEFNYRLRSQGVKVWNW